ncbi:PadR family transcriptional regulator [Cohnella thailandensis]|jgi:Predicted transcriptional regulators|uniref:Helix-turn-helix transcriptional regulator n=1 Tax=Cohnella thailandensis TaxID=557557 RepID=A0A841SUP8_9BACL|nr:PadR family transcriptional regulator [Cohnella thailandensis]MBB6634326.1 helix-turn-helix transcriptional regulator [Cohnella thailandensis]MBP1972175.1 DNA-binding PadR family transcriptional regulator [Cohnella thailandensis]
MSLQIFILGILCEGHRHPYDIKKMFKRESLAPEVRISDGTLYYHFEALTKQKYIERIMVSREENRPERTLYGITELGREALVEMIYKNFRSFKEVSDLYPCILFIHHVSRERVIGMLEDCIAAVNQKIQRFERIWNDVPPDSSEHPIVLNAKILQEHAMNRAKTDLEWLEKVLNRTKSIPS